jgi:hypothetical protein
VSNKINQPKTWILYLPSATRTLEETEFTSHPPVVVDKKGHDGFGGVYVEVVSKAEYEEALDSQAKELHKSYETQKELRAEIDRLWKQSLDFAVEHPTYKLSKELEAENNKLRDKIRDLKTNPRIPGDLVHKHDLEVIALQEKLALAIKALEEIRDAQTGTTVEWDVATVALAKLEAK